MKNILPAFFLLAASAGGFAQSFTLGPKFGVNHTQLVAPQDFLNAETRQGFQLGVFTRIGAGRLYLQPEAYYTTRTSQLAVQPNPGDSDPNATYGNVRFRNVDVPVLLGYKLIDLKLANVRLMGGPVLSYTLSNRMSGLPALDPAAYEFTRNSWALQAGVGVDIALFTLDARYEYGLTEVNRFFHHKPQMFMVSLGLKFL